MTNEQRLMLILAHPDDESMGNGGVIAKYAAEGVKTYLVTATRGEASVLGIHEVSFLDYRDGEFDQAPADEVVAKIVRHIRRVKPHVVITFDQNGLYGHPDHIAICQYATAAVAAAADPSFHDSDDQPSHHVFKLYYMAWLQEEIELYQSAFGELAMQINGHRRSAIPWQEWAITTSIDTSAHWRQVWEAISRHRSQLPGYQKLIDLPEEAHLRLWGSPVYYRAFSRVNGGPKTESDLFAGLR